MVLGLIASRKDGSDCKKCDRDNGHRSRGDNRENIDREGESRITPPHQDSKGADQKQKPNCRDFNDNELENFAAASP
jgi:hypothetical protein